MIAQWVEGKFPLTEAIDKDSCCPDCEAVWAELWAGAGWGGGGGGGGTHPELPQVPGADHVWSVVQEAAHSPQDLQVLFVLNLCHKHRNIAGCEQIQNKSN